MQEKITENKAEFKEFKVRMQYKINYVKQTSVKNSSNRSNFNFVIYFFVIYFSKKSKLST